MSFCLKCSIDESRAFLRERSQIEHRWDPNYYKGISEFRRRIRAHSVSVAPLRDSLEMVQYGISERATAEPIGVPMLRMINLQDDTWDLSDLKYIEMTEKQKEPYLLRSGDILFNRTNSKELVGKCCVFDLTGEFVFASYLIRVRVKTHKLLPEFLTAFLSCDLGRIQIDAVSRQIAGMTNINAEEIRSLSIPVLDWSDQVRVVNSWKAAVQKRDETLEQAKALLASIDDLLLAELGIPNPPEPPNTLESRMFQRQFSEVSGDRFDPHYHHPRFAHLISRLETVSHFSLRDLVDFSHEQWDQKSIFEDTFPYIEIGAVNLEFGRLTEAAITPVSEAANRAKMLVRPGDLLISLTRPTRKAICFSPEELDLAVASNGFCVVRGRKKKELSIRYLFHVLRSCLCNEQFNQRSSGGNYPAITEEQLSRVLIPWAEPKTQERIVQILDKKYAEAGDLFAQAQADLEQAKRDIEAMILGEPTEAV